MLLSDCQWRLFWSFLFHLYYLLTVSLCNIVRSSSPESKWEREREILKSSQEDLINSQQRVFLIGKGPNHVFILSKRPTFSHQMIQDWWAKKIKACLIERQMMSDKNICYRYLPKYCLQYFLSKKKKWSLWQLFVSF